MTPEEDRRQSPRIGCRFNAELYILLPEETFRPFPYMVTVFNVSEGGAMVKCPNIPKDIQKLLATTVRFARLAVRSEGRAAKIYCRIIRATPDNGAIILALDYDPRDAEAEHAIEIITERAKASRREQSTPLPDDEDSAEDVAKSD
ncbi:MAG: PilZ domain-containing protein [Sumerlaeia bacterium]